MKILFANIGYATGINGSLNHHTRFLFRHLFKTQKAQKAILQQCSAIIDAQQPDLCGFAEIDSGSMHSAYLNHLDVLQRDDYALGRCDSKYAPESLIARTPFFWGKCNGLLAKDEVEVHLRHFDAGVKKLVYEVTMPRNITVFFVHLALGAATRQAQIEQLAAWVKESKGEIVIMGDCNIFAGISELEPLLNEQFELMNNPEQHTFSFHKRQQMLDICLCSPALAKNARCQVIDQPYSDHDAIMLEL